MIRKLDLKIRTYPCQLRVIPVFVSSHISDTTPAIANLIALYLPLNPWQQETIGDADSLSMVFS